MSIDATERWAAGATRPAPAAKRRRAGPLLFAIAAQALVLAASVFVVVMIPPSRTEPEFTAPKTIHLPQRELEHRVALAEFQQAVSAPPTIERLTSSALLPDGLPPLPATPDATFTPMETTATGVPDLHALLGAAGFPGAGAPGGASSSSFFGIEDSGQRIVIVVNTSVSVVNKAARRGVTIERIQEEMTGLIENLDTSALFGIVQFSQGVRTFEDFLAPATEANKQAVRQWVPANLRGNPRASPNQEYYGHEAAFAAAFRLEPDVIFLLTDGQLNRREGTPGNYSYPEIPHSVLTRTLRALQRESPRPVRIHAVGFEMNRSDAEGLRRLTREFNGELREF